MLEEEYQPRRRLPHHLRAPLPPEAPFAFEIRPATGADLPDVRRIHAHYVTNSTVTFDDRPLGLAAWRGRLAAAEHDRMPFLVAVAPSGQVLGYALVAPWEAASRAGRRTVEDSIYLGPGSTGKGLGRALLAALVDAAREAGIRRIVAVVADRHADASIALHEKAGFREIGRMGRVGYKFGRPLGTVTLELSVPRVSRGRRERPTGAGGARA